MTASRFLPGSGIACPVLERRVLVISWLTSAQSIMVKAINIIHKGTLRKGAAGLTILVLARYIHNVDTENC